MAWHGIQGWSYCFRLLHLQTRCQALRWNGYGFCIFPRGFWMAKTARRAVQIWHLLCAHCHLGRTAWEDPAMPGMWAGAPRCWPPLRESVAAKVEDDLMKRVWLLFHLFLLLLLHLRVLHKPRHMGFRHGTCTWHTTAREQRWSTGTERINSKHIENRDVICLFQDRSPKDAKSGVKYI